MGKHPRIKLKKRLHKYGVSSKEDRQADGFTFDSKKERDRYRTLKLLQKHGQVLYFLMQVPLVLPGPVRYRVDFLVFWADGHVTYEDVKGMRTKSYEIKKKGIEDPSWIYGGWIEITEK